MSDQELFVKMSLSGWDAQMKRTDKLFSELTDEQLMKETSPGRNRGIYLLGHLTAAHDGMLPLLGFGDKLYPQLEEPFLKTPDSTATPMPSINELKKYWSDVSSKLAAHFASLQPAQWFEKHTAVTEEDFAKEPHRNKLNIILTRTNHLSSHYGQLLYLQPKK